MADKYDEIDNLKDQSSEDYAERMEQERLRGEDIAEMRSDDGAA